MNIQIRMANKEDQKKIQKILKQNFLPLNNFIVDEFYVAVLDEIVGCIAVDIQDNYSILKSLAVKKEYRHLGIGTKLVNKAIRERKRIYLQTMDKVIYFQKLGFKVIESKVINKEILNNPHFQLEHCKTATIMIKQKI